jgi:hypothetical protein
VAQLSKIKRFKKKRECREPSVVVILVFVCDKAIPKYQKGQKEVRIRGSAGIILNAVQDIESLAVVLETHVEAGYL